jgi:hypothetical protein
MTPSLLLSSFLVITAIEAAVFCNETLIGEARIVISGSAVVSLITWLKTAVVDNKTNRITK